MTHPKEAVEAVAQALCYEDVVIWQLRTPEHMADYRKSATALLDRIAPILIAQAVEAERIACTEELRLAVAAERQQCAKVAEMLHETAWPDTIASAIRAREVAE